MIETIVSLKNTAAVLTLMGTASMPRGVSLGSRDKLIDRTGSRNKTLNFNYLSPRHT